MTRHGQWVLAAALGLGSLAGCQNGPSPSASDGGGRSGSTPPVAAPAAAAAEPIYFASPADMPARVTEYLRGSDFASLTRCYDLSLTPRVDVASLRSGAFFVNSAAPANQGPTAVSRYRQPFPPGSRFVEVRADGDPGTLPCIWTMTTMLEIDEGGGMVQRVTRECKIIQTSRGYQFLPPAPIGEPKTSSTPPAPAERDLSALNPSSPVNDANWGAQGSDPALFLRPALADRVAREVPKGGLTNLGALAECVARTAGAARTDRGGSHTGSLPWEPEVMYNPTDSEVIASVAGDRLWRTTQIAPMGSVAEARRVWGGPETVSYPHLEVTRVDVAGTGVRYYARPPVERTITLR